MLLAGVLGGVAPVAAQAPSPAGFELLPGGTLDVRWASSADEAVSAAPAFDAETAYVPLRGGRILALDLDTGRQRWAAAADTTWAPAVGDGRVFLATNSGVGALDATSGGVLWERELPSPAAAPPYWDSGWLVVSLEGGDLMALRAADGEVQWTAPLGAVTQTAPAPALDALFLSLGDGRVVALELATGRSKWTRQIEGRATGVRALDDQLLVGTTARALHSLDLRNGRTRWRWRLGGAAVGAAAADDRRIYVVAYDHLLRAFDRGSGNLRWRRALPHRPAGSPKLVGTMVLVPLLSPEISAYQAATGEPALAIASTGEVSGDTYVRAGGSVGGTRLMAVSVEGRLLAFAPRVEPVPAPLDALPGAAVREAAPSQAAIPPPVGPRDRR
ncbi:MAG: PQQ-binding-like beta-propeller repeat protein [Gaiellales bacterium]